MSRPRDLRPIFDPTSVAVVGASDDPGKWGGVIGRAILQTRPTEHVSLVNARQRTVLGMPAVRSYSDLKVVPELAVVAVPAAHVVTVVDEAIALGTRAFVVVAGRFGEAGKEGIAHERRLVEAVNASGSVLVGPNCAGVADTWSGFDASFHLRPTQGPVAVVSQSGNLGLDAANRLANHGSGISRFVSLGNQADLELGEVLHSLADDPNTRCVVAYAEEVADFRSFRAGAEALSSADKPLIVISPFLSEPSRRAALSHTGAMISEWQHLTVAARDLGFILTDNLETAFATAVTLTQPLGVGVDRKSDSRLAVVSDGGGHAVLSAGMASSRSLVVPEFSTELQESLRTHFGDGPTVSNPVDLATSADERFAYSDAVERIIDSGEADAVLVTGYFGLQSDLHGHAREEEREAAQRMMDVSRTRRFPLVVNTIGAGNEIAEGLRRGGAPVFRELHVALDGLAGAFAWRARAISGKMLEVPAPDREFDTAGGYWTARRIAEGAGVSFPRAFPVTRLEQALEAAETLGYPVALKCLAYNHKAREGGVRLDLADSDDLTGAYMLMAARAPAGAEFSIEEMIAPVSEELIVGITSDTAVGPILLVGAGGSRVEATADVATLLAPASAERVLDMILALEVGKGLAADPGASDQLETVARIAAQLSNDALKYAALGEFELNPVAITPHGVVALDARVVSR